jgi:hypothetical protein
MQLQLHQKLRIGRNTLSATGSKNAPNEDFKFICIASNKFSKRKK